MGENSKIEWTDHTFNPWIGCTKVSPGCAHCYAEELMATRYGRVEWGAGKARVRTSVANWRLPLRWNRDEEGKMVDHAGFVSARRPRVFCASLADWLDKEVPIEWLANLLDLIRRTPNLDWLLLTKRLQNWAERVRLARNYLTTRNMETALWLNEWLPGTPWYEGCGCAMTDSGIIGDKIAVPPANVWIGTTVEDQRRADERIPELLKIPARVRFLSCEPLLANVELRHHLLTPRPSCEHKNPLDGCCSRPGVPTPECHLDACSLPDARQQIHWVICGGESGHGARPMHPAWARSLRDQCAAASVPFLFKQWGEWAPQAIVSDPNAKRVHVDSRGTPTTQDCEAGTTTTLCRYGKHAAGRLLDGVEHNATP